MTKSQGNTSSAAEPSQPKVQALMCICAWCGSLIKSIELSNMGKGPPSFWVSTLIVQEPGTHRFSCNATTWLRLCVWTVRRRPGTYCIHEGLLSNGQWAAGASARGRILVCGQSSCVPSAPVHYDLFTATTMIVIYPSYRLLCFKHQHATFPAYVN